MDKTRDRDGGFSLTEMLVVMMIFSMIMAMVFSILISLTYQARDSLARARSVEQAKLGISQIDRQVRSGNLILDPAADGVAVSGVAPNYSMRIFTQEDGVERCAQWRVYDDDGDGYGNLEFRNWHPDYPVVSDVTEWYVVAQNSVSPPTGTVDAADPETWPPFWLDTNLNTGTSAQNIRITLRMLDPQINPNADPIVVTTVITGRNTVFGYSTSYCSNVPPA